MKNSWFILYIKTSLISISLLPSFIKLHKQQEWNDCLYQTRSYLQQGGRTVLLARQSQNLDLQVRKQCEMGSPQNWASSPLPAWGSYPWVSEGSSGALRAAEWGGSSRSWLQPSSPDAGAARLKLLWRLVRSAGRLGAHWQVEEITFSQLRKCRLPARCCWCWGRCSCRLRGVLAQLSCFLSELRSTGLPFRLIP